MYNESCNCQTDLIFTYSNWYLFSSAWAARLSGSYVVSTQLRMNHIIRRRHNKVARAWLCSADVYIVEPGPKAHQSAWKATSALEITWISSLFESQVALRSLVSSHLPHVLEPLGEAIFRSLVENSQAIPPLAPDRGYSFISRSCRNKYPGPVGALAPATILLVPQISDQRKWACVLILLALLTAPDITICWTLL